MTHAYPDPGQHVVHEHVVHMVLADEVAHERGVLLGGLIACRAGQRCLCLLLLFCTFRHALAPNALRLQLNVGLELERHPALGRGRIIVRLRGTLAVRTKFCGQVG